MKTYYAVNQGWISGHHLKSGESIAMTEAQARYYLLNGELSDTAPAPVPLEVSETRASAVSGGKKSKGE